MRITVPAEIASHERRVALVPDGVARLVKAGMAVTVQCGAGVPAGFRDEHFGSDARFYSELEIPAVCFGPIGAGLHSHDEWVDIVSLEQFYGTIRELAAAY